MVDLRAVEAFLAVGEELHFGRAADRLFVSPSRVSQLVRQLEDRIGAPLFERTTRRVALTVIGEQLACDLGKAYSAFSDALDTARAAATGLEGVLRIGYLTHCDDTDFRSLLSRFQAAAPGCQVATIDITGTDYFETLRSGGVDLALGRFHQAPPDGLVQGPVMAREDWVLGVARVSPLSTQDLVSVEELATHGIFGVPDPLTGTLRNPLYPTETPSGAPIPRQGIARTFAEVLTLAARGENVFPTTASFPLYYRHPGVVFVPLLGWPEAERTLLWRASGNEPLVTAFITLAAPKPAPALPGYRGWPGPRVLDREENRELQRRPSPHSREWGPAASTVPQPQPRPSPGSLHPPPPRGRPTG